MKLVNLHDNSNLMKELSCLILALALCTCADNKRLKKDINYISEVNAYFKTLNDERKSNYLQLIALYPLKEGSNTFGKDNLNDLTLNFDSIPNYIGNFYKKENSLVFQSAQDLIVRTKMDSIVLKTPIKIDIHGNSEKLFHQNLSWKIITRSNQYYLRIWYKKNPVIDTFQNFLRYPIDKNYLIKAQFTSYDKEKHEIVKAKIDGKRLTSFIGNITFAFNDKDFTLEVGNNGFVMVGDLTNSDTTYGGGRYMYIAVPENNGDIRLDFNKLYNPPCSYSVFTTCLFPPGQNQLPFPIFAGEQLILKKHTLPKL